MLGEISLKNLLMRKKRGRFVGTTDSTSWEALSMIFLFLTKFRSNRRTLHGSQVVREQSRNINKCRTPVVTYRYSAFSRFI